MDANRWRQIDELFHAAVACPREERAGILDRNCSADAGIRHEVETLLAAHENASSSFIELSPFELANSFSSDRLKHAAPIAPDGRLGRYTLRRVLGGGGMGIVYEAEQDNPRRLVALKLIRSDLATPALLTRFEHEAKFLARLQHPGIAQIFDAGTESSGDCVQPYLAMELVHGAPIDEYVHNAQPGGLPIRARLELLIAVCDAVAHAHRRGVIHCDLKPSNILVSDEPARAEADRNPSSLFSGASPKILDFGIARAVDADLQTITLHTEVRQLIGTIPYMSPEQLGGDPQAVDTRSDVYALGVLCFELLTERLPYDLTGRNIADSVRVIREVEPQRLGAVQRAFRGDLETITAKALEKDPERRYPSASALASDIRRHLDGQAIAARGDNHLYVLRKALVRHRVGAAVVALATALAISVAWGLRQEQQTARATDAAAELSRIAALRIAHGNPASLENPESPAAAAAATIWRRVQHGAASESEMRELADACVRLGFSGPGLVSLSRHAVREGGYALDFATLVYACPPDHGFLVRPHFTLDGVHLPVDGPVFRSVQRRLRSSLHAPDLTVGQHSLGGYMEVALARVVRASNGESFRYMPLSPWFVEPVGPYRFAAVTEYPPDFPVEISLGTYKDRFNSEVRVAAFLAPDANPTGRMPASGDELHVELTIPSPPLELALRVDLELADQKESVDVAVAPISGDDFPAICYHNGARPPLFDAERCCATLRFPLGGFGDRIAPESLVGMTLTVRMSASREAARSADFERFLEVTKSFEVTIRDGRAHRLDDDLKRAN